MVQKSGKTIETGSYLYAANIIRLFWTLTFDVDGIARLVLDAIIVATISRVIASGLISPDFAQEGLFANHMRDHIFLFAIFGHGRSSAKDFVAFRVSEGLVMGSNVASVFLLLFPGFSRTFPRTGIFFTSGRGVACRGITVVHVPLVVPGRIVLVVRTVFIFDRRKLLFGVIVRIVVHLVVRRLSAR